MVKHPISIDLIFKLLALTILFNSYLFKNEIKLPFIDIFNKVKDPSILLWMVSVATIVGTIAMLFNIAPRLGSGIIAIAMMVTVLGCRPCYSDSRMYMISLLILLALYDTKFGMTFLRIQVIILYFGSGLNKLFDTDWLTGIYIDNWLTYILDSSFYKVVSSHFSDMSLSKFMSWSVILIEIGIALCFTKKKYYSLAIFLGILLHSSSIILTNGVFGSFIASAFISYLAFMNWPDKAYLMLPYSKLSKYIIKYQVLLDPYQIIKIKINANGNRIESIINENKYSNFSAIQHIILYFPIFHFAIIGLLVMPAFGYNWVKGIILIFLAFLMLPMMDKTINHFLKYIYKRKR